MSKKILFLSLVLTIGFSFFIGVQFSSAENSSSQGEVACIMDAKLCSDGSYVSRVAPACEFKACPINSTKPVITEISPASAGAGERITIYGNNFSGDEMMKFSSGETSSSISTFLSAPGKPVSTVPNLAAGLWNVSVVAKGDVESNKIFFTIAAPTTSVVPMTDAEIIAALTLAIRNGTCILVGSCNTNFDLNSDGKVTSPDQLIMRSYSAQSDALFDTLYKKTMAQADAIMGSKTGDAKFFTEYDTNRNGGIDQDDKSRISRALIGARVYLKTEPIISAPTITALSPTFGPIGTTVTIAGSGFTSTGNKVKFGNQGTEYNPSYSINSSDGNTLVFSVPASNYYACLYSTPRCMIAQTVTQPGNYAVSVVNANGTSNALMFTVEAVVSAQPSITVLSPNGGETYKNDGSPITVNWQTKNVPSSHTLDIIRLRAYPNGHEYNLAANVLNDGQEIITVPSSVPVGAYTLEIKTYVDETLVMDSSDSYFKMVDVFQDQPAINTSSASVQEIVKCVFKFKGAASEQKCYTAGDNSRAGCTGTENCVTDISGTSDEKITWKSSCGGYAYTVMDGSNDYAVFYCADTTSGPVTTTPVISEEKPAYDQISDINEKAKLLSYHNFDFILAELNQLRSIIKEQQTEIKYLKSLVKDIKNLSEKSQDAINNFITYGVDENTKKLGAGERAAVMNSYKSAFDKLPETEAELADAIKIANGRFPSVTSQDAEKTAKEQFVEIYKRTADLNNANDNAAIKVMAYGLRQKAANRNLNSEKAGIKIFKNIFGSVPKTTEDWNTMQAITYSGATR